MWYCKLCNWLYKICDIFYMKCGWYLSDSFVCIRKYLDIFNGLGSFGGYFGVIDFFFYFIDILVWLKSIIFIK